MEEELNNKKKYIKDLENKMTKKNQELERLNQDFLNSQEETKTFKVKLKNLEEILREQNESLSENIKANLQTTNIPLNKNAISNLLITPTIRKSIGSSIMDSIENTHQHHHHQHQTEVINTPNPLIDEQNRIKECLAKNFQDKLLNLEKSKMQTKNILESLKLNLNDIELMTANNIFKITSINS